jgi:translation initiation factor 1A
MLGNGRLEAMCFDGEKRLAHIRGKMRKKVWINQGDIILLSLRDFQDDKADVIVKYTADEARNRACHIFCRLILTLTYQILQ